MSRNPEDRLIERLMYIAGPSYDLPPSEHEHKKFTNKCRLFVGNLTDDTTMENFQEMFQVFGEIAEPYINVEKAFGFVKLDYRENAQKARDSLNGTMRNGRMLKVRYSSIGCSLKVKRLSPWVSNELLELSFGVFGELERATVVVDERGKSTGTGIVEFAKKPAAQFCLTKCQENSFFLTEGLCPVEVEVLKEGDESEGLCEGVLPKKNHEYMRERSRGPRLAEPGSFEMEYGNRWKQLYELEKQRREQLEAEIKIEMDKLRDQMEFARREHETEMLREQLRQREQEQERNKTNWDQRQTEREEERRRMEDEMRARQEGLMSGMRQSEEDLKRRQQENQLFMKANELNSLLDQQEQGMGGGGGWGGEQQGGAAGGGEAAAGLEAQLGGYGAQDGGYGGYGGQEGGFNPHAGPPPGRGGGRGGGLLGRGGGQGGDMSGGYGGFGGGRGGRGGFRGGRGRPLDDNGGMEYPNKRPRAF